MICEMFLFLLFQLAQFLSSTMHGFVHSFSACFKRHYTPHIEVKFRRHYLRGCSSTRTPVLIYLAPHINNSQARSLFPKFHKILSVLCVLFVAQTFSNSDLNERYSNIIWTILPVPVCFLKNLPFITSSQGDCCLCLRFLFAVAFVTVTL